MASTYPIKHVAIAGNIGAGKTTLCSLLAERFGWEAHYESADDNPYLSDFYHDMKRWSFNLQVYFLNSRYRQIMEIQQGAKTVVQDRTVYEDAHIFAHNLHEMGLLSTRDFENYLSLFKAVSSYIKPPDLMIYLKADIATLVEHIQARGRDYEGNMSLGYLKKLNQRYEEWISNYNEGPLLIVSIDQLDFQRRPEDLQKMVNIIENKMQEFV